MQKKTIKGINLKIIAAHTAYALTAAAAVGDLLGIDQEQIRETLESFEPVSGRMNLIAGKNGSHILDDSYNSSPDAAMAALDALYAFSSQGRKIAIMGSMNELGSYAKEGHENVGRWCSKLDMLVTVGEEAREFLVPAAVEVGLDASKIESFDSPYEAGKWVAERIKKDDVVLVKGSQNKIFTEEAVKMLLAKPADESKLVRQTPIWMKLKEKQFGSDH